MKEAPVEHYFKERLERHGLLVLKLTTPGYTGTMDRLILRPHWSPGAPHVCEIKRPGEKLRALQVLVEQDWLKRGVKVLGVCDSYERVREIEHYLLELCNAERIDGK